MSEAKIRIVVQDRVFVLGEKEAKNLLSEIQVQLFSLTHDEMVSMGKEEIVAAVKEKFKENGKIPAIKLYCEKTGYSLRAGKDFVEGMMFSWEHSPENISATKTETSPFR